MRIAFSLVLLSLLWQPYPVALAGPQLSDDSDLVLGIFPRRNAKITKIMFQPMADALSRALQRKVVLETTFDFASFWDNVAKQRYDIVHYNQYHYIKSHHDYGYQVIAKNVEFGHADIAAAFYVRKDSHIKSLEDLKGKKIVFGGGRKAMMAYIVPTYLLRQAGLKEGDYYEKFALNPPKSVIASYYHQASAAAGGHYLLELPVVKKAIDPSEMNLLAIGKKLTHLPWAVKQSMSVSLAAKIKATLVGFYGTSQGEKILKSARLNKILPATDSEYSEHRLIVKVVLGEKL